MAQTGYSPILIYSSSTAAAAPAAGSLTNSTLGSELAINITDGKLFYKDNANAVQVIGWKVVPTTAGGTGLTSYAQGDLLYYNSGTTLTALPKNTSATRYLSNTGSNNNPAWAQIDLSNGVTGTLPTSNGGTGLTSFTANGVVYASSTSALTTGSGLTYNGTTLSTTGALQVDGNTTLGDASTDTVQVNGYMGVGGAPVSSRGLKIASNALTSSAQFGIEVTPTNTVAGTSQLTSILSAPIAANTVSTVRHYYVTDATGAGTVTSQIGVDILDLTKGSTNIGIQSAVLSGANKWNIYASGTAANHFAGGVNLGATTDPGAGNLSLTGNVVIATSGKGIDFSVTASGTGTMTSELLDDYEEGTFTPTIVGATVAGTGTYSEQNGFYTKVGNRVMVNLALTWSAHTGTGNMRISGLPFNNENTTGNLAIPSLYVSNIALTAGNTIQAFVNINGTQILLYQVPTGGGASVVVPIDTAGTIYVSMQYQTAS